MTNNAPNPLKDLAENPHKFGGMVSPNDLRGLLDGLKSGELQPLYINVTILPDLDNPVQVAPATYTGCVRIFLDHNRKRRDLGDLIFNVAVTEEYIFGISGNTFDRYYRGEANLALPQVIH